MPLDDVSPANGDAPLATFYRFTPGGRAPQRADRAAGGSVPTRAFRYCEALCAAASFGWYVFPPIRLRFYWEGEADVLWTHEGAEGWYALDSAAQFPGFADAFDRAAPPDVAGFAPPFVARLPEPGVVQVWTGLFARTAPGWGLLVRAPSNMPRAPGHESYEGIVETDTWFGPLFANLRLTRTHAPVELDPDRPFLQVQPVRRALLGDALDRFGVVESLAALSADDWSAFRDTVVRPNVATERPKGAYGTAARQRQRRGRAAAQTASVA